MAMRDLRRGLGVLAVVLALCGWSAVGQVMINEIAWAGTAASANDEWIELYNAGEEPVDLSGWTLVIGESVIHFGEATDATLEVRDASIDAGGYLLLERTDDTTISDIEADIIYKGGLSNGGEDIFLVDSTGETVDEALFAESGWPGGSGGDGDPPYQTLEKIHPVVDGLEWASNWPLAGMTGLDADGYPLLGTPLAVNGVLTFLASAPRIAYVGPTSDEVHGIVAIQWTATDPNGEDSAIRVRIILTCEDPQRVVTLAEDLANTGSFAWDTTEHIDGTYGIDIWVEDSEDYASHAESAPMEVKNDTESPET